MDQWRGFLTPVQLACVILLTGCMQTGTSQQSGSADVQLVDGRLIYSQTCATGTCHGMQGEDIRSGDRLTLALKP